MSKISEGEVQAKIRLGAASHGSFLLRNNSGVLVNNTGRHVRFGLGNESKGINSVFKSSDLIGITTKTCECGKEYGIFTAVEVKASDWKLKLNDKTIQAQYNFLYEIRKRGGLAGFASSVEEFWKVLKS